MLSPHCPGRTAVLSLAVLVAAACGGSSDPDTSSDAPSPSPPAAGSAAEAVRTLDVLEETPAAPSDEPIARRPGSGVGARAGTSSASDPAASKAGTGPDARR